MIRSTEKHDLKPVCPHCEAQIDEVYYKKIDSTFGKRYLYFCSKCNKTLGITQRKGFWMG